VRENDKFGEKLSKGKEGNWVWANASGVRGPTRIMCTNYFLQRLLQRAHAAFRREGSV